MSSSRPYSFRPVEFWKTSIMTLPDNAFFELARTVFGKVKTPFNKQFLVGDLEKFLMRSDIQKNIASYISKQDTRIIAAAAFLNEPVPGALEAFFTGELSYAELNDQLVNLEERFIVYRFQDESSQNAQRIALNPVFKAILLPLVSDSSMLFPSVHIDETPYAQVEFGKAADKNLFDKNAGALRTPFLYDDRIPAALLSFVSMSEPFFKSRGGGIRQKVLNSANALFPNLPMEDIVGALQVLGLFSAKDDALEPDYRRFASFGKLNRQERAEYYAAGIFCHWEASAPKDASASRESAAAKSAFGPADFSDGQVSPWLLRSKVRFYASFIHRLCSQLSPDRLYPFASLQKLAYMLDRDSGDFSRDRLIAAMEKTGLLVSAMGRYWRRQPFAEAPAQDGAFAKGSPAAPPPPSKPVIAMDASFSLMAYPEIEYGDLVKIAAFAHLTEADLNFRFELNRDSVVAAFNIGLSAGSIIELLQRLSQNRIDENLIFALQDWEKSHKEVTLRQGVVLTLSPERQYLAETRPLSTLITETLAPGVYLLPTSLEERAARALSKAGVSIIARHGENADENRFPDAGKPFDGISSNFFPQLRFLGFGSSFGPAPAERAAGAAGAGGAANADSAASADGAARTSGAANAGGDASASGDGSQADSAAPASGDASANGAEAGGGGGSGDGADEAARALIENFHSVLKKMRFDKEKQDELAARIDRRLILCEAQLKDAVLRYEKLEARGLDYTGKTLIAKQAISLQALVEVTWAVKQKQERVLGIPKALEKTGSESILVVKPMDGDEEPARIPMGKISLLRRIKRSIFETTIA